MDLGACSFKVRESGFRVKNSVKRHMMGKRSTAFEISCERLSQAQVADEYQPLGRFANFSTVSAQLRKIS